MKFAKYLTAFSVFSVVVGVATPAYSITVNSEDDANTLTNNILGAGVNIVGTPSYSATGTDASGSFTNGSSSGLGIDQGVLLSTGDATDAVGPNSSDSTTTDNGLSGDSDLDALISNSTNDATVLEFDFQFGNGSQGGDLFFNYAFASEEYNEFVNSPFNDVFGLFVDGQNIAKVPGTNDPVAIDNVNNQVNSQFYNNNDPSDTSTPFDIEYDGFTDTFQAQATNLSPGTHSLKLAIGDTGDSNLDSGLFIEGNSVSNQPSEPVPFEAEGAAGLVALGGFFGYRYLKNRKKRNQALSPESN